MKPLLIWLAVVAVAFGGYAVITAYAPNTTATIANQISSGFTRYPPALNRAAILNSTSSALASMLAASTSDDTRPSSSRSASKPTV